MGIRLIDGSTSVAVGVTSENHMLVDAVTETEFEHSSLVDGLAFAWVSDTYDAAAADTILLVKNTSTSRKLVIDSIHMNSDVETRVKVHIPATVTTPAGTTVTGTPLNTALANVADAVAMRDETANSIGSLVWIGEIQAAGGPFVLNVQGGLVLGQNASVAVDFVADSAVADVTIWGHYI